MTNFGAKILNNSVGALNAQQAVIASIANNISNVNTPGYTRRVIDLQTRVSRGTSGLLEIGNGVEVGRIMRINDAFLNRQLYSATGESSSANVQSQFLDRLQKLFNLTGDSQTIGSTLTSFFNAANDLSNDPANINLRSNFIARANDLTNSINNTFNSVAALQTEADRRIQTEIQNVNSITSQIADLNARISAAEGTTNTVAGDERDRRDVLLQQLGEKINFTTVEDSDGSVTLSLSNGFPLVSGSTARALETSTSPSFVTTAPPSLDGGNLSYIVFDYSGGAGAAQHIDLTQTITGGSIGGLLAMRGYNDPANTSAFSADGTLVEVASRIEALARNLLTSMNTTYLGPDRDSGTAGHQPSSGDLDGNVPSNPFALFNYSGASDANADGLPTNTDLTASGHDSFASLLRVAITDPRDVAAARDASGGPPAAASFPTGDGRNMQAIGALQSQSYTLTVGSYAFTGTLDQSYSETVTKVGNDMSRAQINAKVAEGSLQAAQSRRDEVSGVSLDEEFTNLVKFQKAYQAAARMIKVGDELLTQVIQLL